MHVYYKRSIVVYLIIVLLFCTSFVLYGCDNNDIKISKIIYKTASGSSGTVTPLEIAKITEYIVCTTYIEYEDRVMPTESYEKLRTGTVPGGVCYGSKDSTLQLTTANYKNYTEELKFCFDDISFINNNCCLTSEKYSKYREYTTSSASKGELRIDVSHGRKAIAYRLGIRYYSNNIIQIIYPKIEYKGDAAIITYFTKGRTSKINDYTSRTITVNKSMVQVYYD